MRSGLGRVQDRGGRRWLSFAIGVLLAGAAFQAGSSPAGAGSAAAAAAAPSDLNALVLGKAKSPILKRLRSVSDLSTVRHTGTNRHHPRHYELLIVDGHHLKPRALRHRPTMRRFLAAGRWVAAFDVGIGHHEAIRRHTGFDVADGEETDRSGMLLFRISTAGGSPTVEIIDSGPPGVRAAKHLGDKHKRKLKRRHARRIARLADRRIGSEAVRAAGSSPRTSAAARSQAVACPPLEPAPAPDLQHVGWCYTDAGQKPVPNGFWTQAAKLWWIDPYPTPGNQTASWTMNHRFDVFLNNDTARPQGNFQTIVYSLNGQFAPKRVGESFFRMFDKFTSGWHGERITERAWWTGRVGVGVRPDEATDAKLSWQASHPESANSETQYSSGEEFSVGFTGTAASPDGGLGVGANFSYTSSNSKSYSIPDWGVQNQSSGNELRWAFTARNPCDVRPGHFKVEDCFDRNFNYIGPFAPTLPNELSRSQLQVNASGRWRTKQHLKSGGNRLKFALLTPVALFDSYCDGAFIGGWCAAGRSKVEESASGPLTDAVEIDAAWVNPVPVEALKLSPDPADGGARQKVEGKVVLKSPPPVPVDVRILSNSPNAVVGAPLPGVAGGSQATITINPREKSGTFTVKTNDNKLNPGQHTIASITAFYTDATTEELRIERR